MNHFQLFPKSVAQVIQKYNVEELRLAFTQGRWKHNKWGVPILDAPSGVQIASSFWSTEYVYSTNVFSFLVFLIY